MDEANEKAWATLCHLGVLAGGLLPLAGNLLVPAGIWLWYRRRSPLIDAHGRESIDFQLTISAIALAAAFVTARLPAGLKRLGFGFWAALGLFAIVSVIRAAMAAYRGAPFRYPLALRPLPPAS
jgi:uncharacterized protein